MKRFILKTGTPSFLFWILFPLWAHALYPAGKIETVLKESETYLGTRWVLGGHDRHSIDCSALVQNSFAAAKISLPRTSRHQFRYKKGIDLKASDEFQKGDLLFFSSGGHYVGHVGIVSEVSSGKVKFIHSSKNNGKVAYDFLADYYLKTFVGGKRLFENLDENEITLAFDWIPEFPGPKNKADYNLPGKYPEASERLLSFRDIEDLSPCEVKITKNEIFARHGYEFHLNRHMKRYFNRQSWYRKIKKRSRDDGYIRRRYFSEIERENVEFLKRFEGVCWE